MKLKLPDSIASRQDVTSLTLEVSDYARWFYHNSVKSETQAKHVVLPPVLSPAALELIRSWNGDKLLNHQSLVGLIKQLEAYQADAPIMTITLAAPPAADLKKVLVAWCRENIAPNVLVSFQFNAVLLGGMVVRCGSHIFDWSFRRQILATRQNFPEVLRRV